MDIGKLSAIHLKIYLLAKNWICINCLPKRQNCPYKIIIFISCVCFYLSIKVIISFWYMVDTNHIYWVQELNKLKLRQYFYNRVNFKWTTNNFPRIYRNNIVTSITTAETESAVTHMYKQDLILIPLILPEEILSIN